MTDRPSCPLLRLLVTSLLTLLLAACGGGGADPGEPTTLSASPAALGGKQAQAGPSVNQFKANGWFWNPQEGGTGFMFEAQGNRGFVAFFMYEDVTAKPIWYAADGAFVANADGSFGFSGDLRVYRNGQAVSSTTYRAPTSVSLGTVALSFVGNSATAQLPAGRQILATRYDYAGLGSAQKLNQPETGWYFNPAQGGRGYAIEVQNNELFMAMFHYNEDGSPTWNVVDGNISTGVLSAQLQRFTGGQSLTSSYRSPGGASYLGDFTLSFRNACAGQVQFGGVPVVNLQRFVIGGGALPYGGECRHPSPNWYGSSTIQRLEPGDLVYGHTGNPQPGYDLYSIRLVAGETYTIDMMGESSGAGTLADPFLTLEYAGRQVAGNDNRAVGTTDARLTYTPSVTSGAYTLRAGSQNAGSGSFQLKVSGVAGGLVAQPVPPVAAYRGSYRGTVNGSETGGLQFTVSSAGDITGSLSLNQRSGAALGLQGRVVYGGLAAFATLGPEPLSFQAHFNPSGPLAGSWLGSAPAQAGHLLAERTAGTALSALQGPLSLNYRFNGSGYQFSDATVFTAASLSSDGNVLVNFVTGSSSRILACTVAAPAASVSIYVCLAQYTSSTSLDAFVFNLVDGRIYNGLYEYCVSGTTATQCIADLLADPDGVVSGGLFTADGGMSPAGLSGTPTFEQSQHANKPALKALGNAGSPPPAWPAGMLPLGQAGNVGERLRQLGAAIPAPVTLE